MQLLLNRDDIELNLKDNASQKPLWYAMEIEHGAMV
jgi:hypothetical protein